MHLLRPCGKWPQTIEPDTCKHEDHSAGGWDTVYGDDNAIHAQSAVVNTTWHTPFTGPTRPVGESSQAWDVTDDTSGYQYVTKNDATATGV